MKTKKISKLICLALSALLVFVLAACNSGKTTEPESYPPIVTPGTAVFDKAESADLSFDVDLKGGSFLQIKRGDAALSGADYALKRTSFALKAAYLNTLAVGEHTFSFITGGGSANFTVTVQNTKLPEAEEPVVAYFTDAGGPLNVPINTKGLAVQSITSGGFPVGASNYSYENGVLTFIPAYAYTLEEGEHTFTLTTSAGSVDFTVSVVVGLNNVLLDQYVVQKSPTADIVFTADTEGTPITAVKADDKQLTEGVDWAVKDNRVAISGSYLATLGVGIKRIQILAGDTAYICYAGVYGKESDQSHLFGSSIRYALMNNFEGYIGETGAGKTGIAGINAALDTCEYGITPNGDPLSISGKSYSITSKMEMVAWIFGVDPTGLAFKANTLYNIKLKVRGDTQTTDTLKLFVTWDDTKGTSQALRDFLVIQDLNNPDSTMVKKDARTTAVFVEDAAGGYWEISAYAYSDVPHGSLTFAIVNEQAATSTAESYTTIIDDIQITETKLPLKAEK